VIFLNVLGINFGLRGDGVWIGAWGHWGGSVYFF